MMDEVRTPTTAWAGSLVDYKGKRYRVVDVINFDPFMLTKDLRCVEVGSKKRKLRVKVIRG